MTSLTALESKRSIRSAARRLASHFADEIVAGVPTKLFGELWRPSNTDIWCLVDEPKPRKDTGSPHYWIGFGRGAGSWKKRIVQCDLPEEGKNRHYAAVFAKDGDGEIWLMHNGRISGGGATLPKDELERTYHHKRVDVEFSDGKSARYYPVVKLGVSNRKVYRSIRDFLDACQSVRLNKLQYRLPVSSKIDSFARYGSAPGDWFISKEPSGFEASRPAYCYILRFGTGNPDGNDTWKIGWTTHPIRRLGQINAHIPISIKGSWKKYFQARFPTATIAFDAEQKILREFLKDKLPRREQVICNEDTIRKVCKTLIKWSEDRKVE